MDSKVKFSTNGIFLIIILLLVTAGVATGTYGNSIYTVPLLGLAELTLLIFLTKTALLSKGNIGVKVLLYVASLAVGFHLLIMIMLSRISG